MTDTALAAAGMIIAFMVGYWIGRRDAPKPKKFETILAVSGRTTYYLRDFGMLDVGRAYALASRIARGLPIRYKLLVGKNKLLRRSEWDNIIIGGLLEHGRLVRKKDKTLAPTPLFVEICTEMIPPHARTSTHKPHIV